MGRGGQTTYSMKSLFAAVSALLCALHPLHAASWNESIDGDLTATITSNIASSATNLNFDLGVNVVTGTMGGDPGDGIPLDRDFFTFTVAPSQSLTSINFLAFSPAGASFYAIAPGTSISLNDPAGHLSNVLISSTGEYLDDLDLGSYSGGTGLTAPLGAGNVDADERAGFLEDAVRFAGLRVEADASAARLLSCFGHAGDFQRA